MFKITKDSIYLFVIFWLLLVMTVEFQVFVRHYEYLTSVLKLIYKFKNEQDLITDYNLDNWNEVIQHKSQ